MMRQLRTGMMTKTLTFAAIVVFSVQGFSAAETTTGRVISVDAGDGTLIIEKASPYEQAGEEMRIHIDNATQMVGISSLDEIEVGEHVSVDGNRVFFLGPWKADQLAVAEEPFPRELKGSTEILFVEHIEYEAVPEEGES